MTNGLNAAQLSLPADIIGNVANTIAIPEDVQSKPVSEITIDFTNESPEQKTPDNVEYKTENEAYVKGFFSGLKDYYAEKFKGTGKDLKNIAMHPLNMVGAITTADVQAVPQELVKTGSSFAHLLTSTAKFVFPYLAPKES